MISLAAGEPDFDTPERIKEAARKALGRGPNQVHGSGRNRRAQGGDPPNSSATTISTTSRARSSRRRDAKQAEANVIAALFDEGDEVIIPTPAWVSFAAMVSLAGAEAKFVPVLRRVDGFMLEPEALRRAITPRTRGIMLNSPSNPTGAVYGPESLAAIARVLVDTDIWVMSDDVYEHIVYERAGAAHFAYRAAAQVARHRVQLAVEDLRDDRMAHRICRRAQGSDRGCRPLAEPEQRQSQFDHAGGGNRGADRSAGRAQADARGVSRAQRDWSSSACGASRASGCPTCRTARSTPSRTCRDCSAPVWRQDASPTATGSQHGCSTRRTSRSSAATTSARPNHVRLSYATSMANLNEAFDRIERAVAKLKR